PAGPPAAILLYTLAPDLLLGWPRANRPEECAYMLPDVCTRAEVGRITGRGNTANLESVIALKPDLILDVGSTSATFVSLAERVQQQTNIPYALLDGRFDAVAETYR
ncbi:MAG: iron ABC transporter substrate-binding protein, partial [Pseudolabrys sp.]